MQKELSSEKNNKVNDIDLTVLRKAYLTLVKFLINTTTDQEKAGVIQAFEFCYELSWKMMKKVLYREGIQVNSPREVFREAGTVSIISDVGLWFEFIKIRNRTVHTYNEIILNELINVIPKFKNELEILISVLEQRLDKINEN